MSTFNAVVDNQLPKVIGLKASHNFATNTLSVTKAMWTFIDG